eukprot:4917521-Pyramimonas_sp.AAC.1
MCPPPRIPRPPRVRARRGWGRRGLSVRWSGAPPWTVGPEAACPLQLAPAHPRQPRVTCAR